MHGGELDTSVARYLHKCVIRCCGALRILGKRLHAHLNKLVVENPLPPDFVLPFWSYVLHVPWFSCGVLMVLGRAVISCYLPFWQPLPISSRFLCEPSECCVEVLFWLI